MPLYVADYATRLPILLHAASPEHAVKMLEGIKEEMPRRFHLVPDGIVMAELYVEDEDSQCEEYAERDEIPNPANHSQVGYAFEPLEGFSDWLTLMIEASEEQDAAEKAETAAPPPEPETQPAPLDDGRDWPACGACHALVSPDVFDTDDCPSTNDGRHMRSPS